MTKTNETGLKDGRRNRNVNYSAFHIRDAPLSFALKYLPGDKTRRSSFGSIVCAKLPVEDNAICPILSLNTHRMVPRVFFLS